MYAYSAPQAYIGERQVDFKELLVDPATEKDYEDVIEFAYWRKFNALHGWMEKLYFSKGGQNPDFNCDVVRLTRDDLDELGRAAIAKELKPCEGFFFGDLEEFCDEDVNEVLAFVSNARAKIDDGLAVFYDSWW